MKLISLGLASLFVLFAHIAFAADENWSGELYNIMPKNSSTTEEYCKTHVLDTYQASVAMIHKEVTGANGVKGKNLYNRTKMIGDIYMHSGAAMFSGVYEDKPWKEKVYYYSQSLEKDGFEQGIWYTKNCKGFFKVGPEKA